MKPKCCKTCIWSRWHLTTSGRIKRDSAGKCVVPLPVVELPDSVTHAYDFRQTYQRTHVAQDSGKTCPLWEENQVEPIAEDAEAMKLYAR